MHKDKNSIQRFQVFNQYFFTQHGMARLCTVKYSPPTSSNISNTYMHLTNYSINKNSDEFVHTNEENSGSKRTYKSIVQVSTLVVNNWVEFKTSTIA